MIRGVTRPSIFYDLVGLANNGVVNIGRESESTIRLDCPEVPFLLSRKHAVVRVQPDGAIVMRDLNSTNGTYVGRDTDFLHRMRPDEVWELKKGDIVGFGGPETIVARSEQPDIIVANPFLFKYVPLEDPDSVAPSASGAGAAEEVMPGLFGVNAQPRRLSYGTQEAEMDVEEAQDQEASTSSGANKENKRGKRKLPSGRDVATMLSNHLTCSICHEWLAASHALSCGHMFCGVCLANWMKQKQSCPECRKPIVGMPVRCRNVDNTITDLQGHNLTSPTAKRERRRKTNAWEEVCDSVADEWEKALLDRRQKANQNAAMQLAILTGVPVPQQQQPAPQQPAAPAAGAGGIVAASGIAPPAPVVVAGAAGAVGAPRQGEHGAAPQLQQQPQGRVLRSSANGRYAAR